MVQHYYPHLTERTTVYFQLLTRKTCCSEVIRRQSVFSVEEVCCGEMIGSQSVLNSHVCQNCCGLKLSSCGSLVRFIIGEY